MKFDFPVDALNFVQIEGVIVKKWKKDGKHYFLLVSTHGEIDEKGEMKIYFMPVQVKVNETIFLGIDEKLHVIVEGKLRYNSFNQKHQLIGRHVHIVVDKKVNAELPIQALNIEKFFKEQEEVEK